MAEVADGRYDPLDLAPYLRKACPQTGKHVVAAVWVSGLLLELPMQKRDIRHGLLLRTLRLHNIFVELPTIDESVVRAGAI